MRRIGMVGGLGPESTVDYYKEIIQRFKDEGANFYYPEIIIYSVTIGRFLDDMNHKRYDTVVENLTNTINNIENAGADFVFLSANTPHLLFDEIQSKVSIPMISIVEATAEHISGLGLKKCVLLGTKFTMENTFYHKVFDRFGIELIVPDQAGIEFIHEKLFTEIELGIFKEETKNSLLELSQKLVELHKADAVIQGCTELPLIMPEVSYFGVPFLNTTKIHVDKIVKYCKKA